MVRRLPHIGALYLTRAPGSGGSVAAPEEGRAAALIERLIPVALRAAAYYQLTKSRDLSIVTFDLRAAALSVYMSLIHQRVGDAAPQL